jgi:hypothetical protein
MNDLMFWVLLGGVLLFLARNLRGIHFDFDKRRNELEQPQIKAVRKGVRRLPARSARDSQISRRR